MNVPNGHVTAATAAALVVATAGCAEAPAAGDDVVRDSAGIVIVENRSPAWDESTAWRLADSPAVVIGVAEGSPAYELHEPRSALRLSDGRIVVGNNGTRQIRYYDATGSHLLDAGGEGAGPGEFRRLSWLGRLEGDSLAVYDQTQLRLSILDPQGRYVRDVSLSRTGPFFPMLMGQFSDGSYVAQARIRPRGRDLPFGLGRDSMIFLRFDGRGRVLDTLGLFPNRVFDVQVRGIGDRAIRGPADVAFSPRTVSAVRGDRTIVGSSDSYEIGVYDTDGTLTRIIRKEHAPVSITSQDRDELVAMWREIYAPIIQSPEVQFVLRSLERSPLPEAFPAFDPMELDERGRRVGVPLLVDTGGNLWVAQYRRVGDNVPRWDVFDSLGRLLGTVVMPERFRLTDAGPDYVLGFWSDQLGVEHVSMYELIKPEA